MFIKKSILFWMTTGIVLGTSAIPTQPQQAYPTVFGYRAQKEHISLTEDGHVRFGLKNPPVKQQPYLVKDMENLARQLNQLRAKRQLNPASITPVIAGTPPDLHYEIWHKGTFLMTLNPAWKQVHESDLSCLLRLTNGLRESLGAAATDRISSRVHHQKGHASWYGGFFHGRLTANGERYDIGKLTAAHKKLPFGTRVLVTNLKNKKSVVVKINDRGPFVGERIIDLSPAAFQRIGHLGQGVMQVKLTVLS